MLVAFTLAGDHVGRQQPQTNTKTGTTFTPKLTRDQFSYVKLAAQQAMDGRTPIEGPVRMVAILTVAIPASWPSRDKLAAMSGILWPTSKPDITNIIKLIEDACKGVVYRDDKQIVRAIIDKRYGTHGEATITFESIEPPAIVAPAAEPAAEAGPLFNGGTDGGTEQPGADAAA